MFSKKACAVIAFKVVFKDTAVFSITFLTDGMLFDSLDEILSSEYGGCLLKPVRFIAVLFIALEMLFLQQFQMKKRLFLMYSPYGAWRFQNCQIQPASM